MTFGRPSIEERKAERATQRAANMRVLCTPSRGLHKGVYAANDTHVEVRKDVKAKPGKGKPNAEERRWVESIVAYGCIACRMDGLGAVPPAVHHILRGGRRIGHLFTLPLCDPGHHQNGAAAGKVSRHPWKARFEKLYGSEDFLLRKLRAEIGAAP